VVTAALNAGGMYQDDDEDDAWKGRLRLRMDNAIR